jgi:hypothetical protein
MEAQGYLAASHNYLRKTVGGHPAAAAAVLATLVVLTLVLVFVAAHYRAKVKKLAPTPSEGLAVGAPSAACAPGESAVTYQNPDGSVVTYCRSTDSLPGPAKVCHRGWDPAASAEAEALATVGSLQHDSYGEGKLQRAINAAYDANTDLSDSQLEAVMHQGGAP